MKKVIKMVVMRTHRNAYGLDQLGQTLTVRELINELENYPSDMKVCYSNDGGYTYGEIWEDDIGIKTEIEEDEEDEE